MEFIFQLMIYIFDFKKDLDSISHVKFIFKLCAYGLPQTFVNWAYVFLNNKTQQVSINGVKSNAARVNRGMLLENTLFLLCVNELGSILLDCHIRFYADDIKFF